MSHPYVALFALTLLVQLGLPIPVLPFLLGFGALAAQGRVNLWLGMSIGVAATLIGDLVWFHLGRARGARILNLLCRISLEPDSCVRRTQGVFERYGSPALLWSKFAPGLGLITAPLAGMIGMAVSRFLLWDAFGSLVWVATCLGLGWMFSDQLERLTMLLVRMGGSTVATLSIILAADVIWKYVQRQLFIRELRIARITPEELSRKITAGEAVLVVDLRQAVDFDGDPRMPPGALRMDVSDLEQRHLEIPRDRDVILYCT